MSRVVLVINEIGMGNGVLESPFVLALAKRSARIVHIQNPFFEALGPRAFGTAWTFFPAAWAIDVNRLCRDIPGLASDMGVTHMVNFRNEDEGNEWNRCFAELREDLASAGIEVWDLRDQRKESGPYIQSRWREMFRAHGVTADWVSANNFFSSLVRSGVPRSEGPVVLCTGGSREDKCLTAEIWAGVVTALRSVQMDMEVRLVHGRGTRERELGRGIETLVGPMSGGVTVANSVEDLATELACASAVVSNDSFPMHLAYALDRPTLGLFSTTHRAVWGPPDGPRFRGLSSWACKSCHLMPAQGTCWAQQACPSPPNASWSASVIADEIQNLMRVREK